MPVSGCDVPLTNAVLAELLCAAAEEPERSYQQQRALRRAGRAAFPSLPQATSAFREASRKSGFGRSTS